MLQIRRKKEQNRKTNKNQTILLKQKTAIKNEKRKNLKCPKSKRITMNWIFKKKSKQNNVK